jgi:hypothetical protein
VSCTIEFSKLSVASERMIPYGEWVYAQSQHPHNEVALLRFSLSRLGGRDHSPEQQSHSDLAGLACLGCVAGAWLGVLPFLQEYQAEQTFRNDLWPAGWTGPNLDGSPIRSGRHKPMAIGARASGSDLKTAKEMTDSMAIRQSIHRISAEGKRHGKRQPALGSRKTPARGK